MSTKAKVPIKAAKVKDINKQLRFIPIIYHGLYMNLIKKCENEDVASDDSFDQPDSNASLVKPSSLTSSQIETDIASVCT